MWDDMPEILRLRALLLVDDTDKFIETYHSPCELSVARNYRLVSHGISSPTHGCLVEGMPGRCATAHWSERPAHEEGHQRCRASGSRDLLDVPML